MTHLNLIVKIILSLNFFIWICFAQAGQASSTEESPIFIQSLFTNGTVEAPDYTLVNYLRNLIQKAAPGSEIKFSVFLFYYENHNEPILLDLINAAARGVHVQILMDLPEEDQISNRSVGRKFQEKLSERIKTASTGKSNSWVSGSERFKNHTKIFLFSDSAGEKNWVIIGSENLTDKSTQKHQSSLVIRDSGIYAAHHLYWHQIKDNKYKDLWIDKSNPRAITYFFPQLGGHDHIYEMLNQFIEDEQSSGTLYISMARWHRDRFNLAMKFKQLADKGINIEIVTRENASIVSPEIIFALKNSDHISLYTNDVKKINIHSKYMLFNGRLNGIDQKIVWTGSHNFTGAGLRDNYETMAEVRDDKAFEHHLANFNLLKDISKDN